MSPAVPTGTSPTVAVVVPVYNRAAVVAEAIQSALGQTHPSVEVHVVNDGSTDGTGSLLDSIAATDHRVVVSHQPNAGPAAARNRAIAGCRAEWITFLDSDDLLLPDAVAGHFSWLAENPGYAAVMGRSRTEFQPGVEPPPLIAAKFARDETVPIFHTALLRRDAVVNVGGYDESLRIAEDTDLHLRLVEAGVSIGVRDEAIIVRRIFGDNLSYERPEGGTDDLLDLAQRAIDRKRRRDSRPCS